MSFAPFQTSRAKGTPTFTYLFEWGEEDGSYFAYTNHEEAIPLEDGIQYEPAEIRHGNLRSSGNLDNTSLAVRAQRDIGVRTLFLIWPPSSVVNLTIRQGHFSDPDSDFKVIWSGRVLSCEREDSECVMTCQPISTKMRRPNLRRYYTIQCPHLLYGLDCKASRTARTVTTTVTTVIPASHSIIVPGGFSGSIAWQKFRQGEARWVEPTYGEVEKRTILSISAGVGLILSGPLTGLSNGQSIDLSAGCNHTTSAIPGTGDCTNLHVQAIDDVTPNGPNFGGFKWAPKKNPTGFRNGWY